MAVAIENEKKLVTPSCETLVQRARDMQPRLRALAQSVEENRAVPQETVDAFRAGGFFKILQPPRWGGYGMSPEVLYRVVMELSRACPSSGWIMAILGIHQWEFGKLDPRACDEVWRDDPEILVSSSYAPLGKARKVDGGWMLSGRWPTSSGCDFADWGAFLGARVFDDQGNFLDLKSFLVKHEDYVLIDDWHVVGLAGTASKSLLIEGEAFIPDYRAHSMVDYRVIDADTCYQMPFIQTFNNVISAAIIGMAQGMVDLFVEHTIPKTNQFAMGPGPAKNPFVQEKLGNAMLLIRSARARLLQDFREMTEYAARRELIPLELRVQYWLDGQATARDCFAAGHSLFKKSGARGVFLNTPMQRQLDVQAVGGILF